MLIIHIPAIVLVVSIIVLAFAIALMLYIATERERIYWHGVILYIYALSMCLAIMIGFILCSITYEAMK